MNHPVRRPRVVTLALLAGGLFLLAVVGWAAAGAGEAGANLPAMRATDGVPAAWKDVKVDWKGSWEETLAANLDPGKTWLKTLEADESLRQAAGLIVRLREIQLLEAMIAHFPQAGAKRQEAYRAIAKAYVDVGDRLRAVQWLKRLIADYGDSKPAVAEALAAILETSCPFDGLPEGRAWAQYASEGIEALVKGGQLSGALPLVVQARGRICAAWRADQRPWEARRFLDSLRAAEGKQPWWLAARADLMLGAGHIPQAAQLYHQAGDAARATSVRDQLWVGRPDVEVPPPPPELAQRIERLAGAIRLTGAKALQDPASIQDILNRCADSGAVQIVDDSLQCSSVVLLDRALRELKADLGPVRQWQQQKADARVDALLGEGAPEEAARLVRRYPWARRVQEVLIERGEQILLEGRADEAAGAFENAAVHAEDPTLLAQARVGLWLATGQGMGGPVAMERAMAQVPDKDPMPRRGSAGTAAQAKAFVRNRVGAGEEALASLPRAPWRRLQLPAAMTAQAPAWRGRSESWCLGPWAIRRIEPPPGQVLVFGPRHVACYDGASLALRWHYAAPDALAEPGPDDDADDHMPPAWRPSAMASASSPSVAGNVAYALLARGASGADLRALDVRTGRLIWTTQGRPEWNALRLLSEPAAMEDLVYVLAMEQDIEGTCTPYLVCLAGEEPKILWKRRLGTTILRERPIAMARYACGVALHQGSVYVSTNMGILAKCDARTGSLEWLRTYHAANPGEAAAGRARREGSVPLVAGDLVYLAPRDHSGVIALDRQTGQLAWESPLVPSDQIVGLAGRALIVRDANELAALDAITGEELWNRPVESDGAAPAVISGGQVLAAAGDKLLRFSAQTGQVVEDLASPRPIGAEHMFLPGGALVDVAEEPLLERTLAAEASANPGPLRPPFVKRWALPCRDPLLVVSPASTPPSDLIGVLSGARFFCVRVRPACRLAWQTALRERPDSVGFHGRLVVFSTGDNLTALDKETGAVRWRRTLPFAADLIAGDDRAFVVGHSSPEAPVMALSPETGEVLWYRWFGQEARFTGRRLRWLALGGESSTPPVLRLYWEAAMFAREGPHPAEVLVEAASGAIRDVRAFLPQEPAWPARIYFGDDHRTRTAPEAALPWPYRGPFRPDAVAYLGKDKVARFALREGGADLAGGWNPQAEASIEAARRWAGLFPTPAGCYVKRPGQLAFFDAQAKREILLALPRTGDRESGSAVGDFREEPGDQLTVVSVPLGRPDETAAGDAPAGADDGSNIVGLQVAEFTKNSLRDDLGNGDVTLTYYGSGMSSQVRIQSRNLPEAGSNLAAALLNGVTREHYRPQPVKMTGLSSLGWAKYDVFLYGDTVKGLVTITGGAPQENQGTDFKTPAHRTTFIRNVNYVKFEGISGDAFTVDFNGDFSAIQVVDASGRLGPRGSLGVRWTGRGPVLGPEDKIGAEFAAGSWYNIVTDYPRKKVFALSGGCQTIGRGVKRRVDPRKPFAPPGPAGAAGKKLFGFVDVFDRKSGQVVNSLPLPAGEAPASAIGYDAQAKILDDALLVTDGNGVYVFGSAPAAAK